MLNLQEIFVWYFEQKGVDNPERFLGVGANGDNSLISSALQAGMEAGVNGDDSLISSALQAGKKGGVSAQENVSEENKNLSQEKAEPENSTEQSNSNLNSETILKLISMFGKYIKNAKKSQRNSFESMLSQVLAK